MGNYRVDLASFESLALPALVPPSATGARGVHVAVVDEVGKMELFSARFCAALPPLFERPHTLVLGTLMERRGAPLAEQIRSLYAKLYCSNVNLILCMRSATGGPWTPSPPPPIFG